MSRYIQDIFYLSSHGLSPQVWEEICRDAKDKSYTWWIDHLPGWRRERIDMDFDEILKYLYTGKIHFSVIHRRGYEDCNTEDSWNKWHLEIGFCTMARKNILPSTKLDIKGDLFLWIKLDEKYVSYFVEKYNLKL